MEEHTNKSKNSRLKSLFVSRNAPLQWLKYHDHSISQYVTISDINNLDPPKKNDMQTRMDV